MTTKAPTVYCPTCILDAGVKRPLDQNGFISTCGGGHRFEDREELSALMMAATEKLRGGKKATVPPPVTLSPEETAGQDVTIINKSGNGSPNGGIGINPVDFSRLTGILGHFTDGASLFGAVYALNEQLLTTQELLQRAEASRRITEIRKIGGDVSFQAIIPERWVESVQQIAEANGLTVERYMAAMIEDGLDKGWFV